MLVGAKCEERRARVAALEDRAKELKQEIEQLQQEEKQSRQEELERHQEAKEVNLARIEILKVIWGAKNK